MSVWEDIDSLKAFVCRSSHVELIQDSDAWFHKTSNAHQALWWVPTGHIPDTEEGKQKLNHLQKYGLGKSTFTFAKPQKPPIEV